MKYLLSLLFLGVIFACGGHADFERRLSVADTLMNVRPDSAYRMLCAMDAGADSVPTALRMRHLLLRCNAQNKSDVLFTSDSVGRLLTAYYDRHGSPNERMLAHYMQGCAYRDMQDWPSAVRCFNAAVAAADTAAVDCDFEQLSIIYGQIAVIFERQYLHQEALVAYDFAGRYAQDTLSLLNIKGNKSNVFIKKGEIDNGLKFKEETANSYRMMGFPKKAAQTLGPCIKWYARKGDFEKAESAINEYESQSGFFLENGEIKPGREDYYHIKGTYYEEKGDLDSAEHYFRKLQRNGKTVNDHYLAALGLTRLFRTQHKEDSVAKYAWQTFQYCDSLYNKGTAEKLQEVQGMYNYSRHQETALRKDMEAQEAKIQLLYVVVAGTVLLFSLTFVVLFFRRKRRLHRIRMRRKIHARLTEKSAKERSLNEKIAENKRLIASLNQQLNENAVDLQRSEHMKETIRILEEQVERHQQEIRAFTQSQHASHLQKEAVIVQFIDRVKRRKGRPDKEEEMRIRKIVEYHYPGMLKIERNPKVKDSEYRICILLKIGLDLQSIMYIENITNHHLSTMRKRLMEKVFGTEGGASDFDHRLAEI